MLFALPEVSGRFPVGATTFVLPLKQPRIVGTSQIRIPEKDGGSGEFEPTLKLEEIAFTAFYPAQTDEGRHSWLGWAKWGGKAKKGMDWLIR